MENELKKDFTRRLSQCNSGEMIVIIYDIFFAYVDDIRQAHCNGDHDGQKDAIRNVICPKKWFSDEGGMSANRGKAGQKEICDKKKEKRYVWQEKEQAEQTMRNHAERRELKPPVFSWLLLFLRKDSCETYTPDGTCGISWGMRYAFLNIRYFLSMRHVGRSLPL